MITNLIMILIVVFLAIVLLFGARLSDDNYFFNKDNSVALRGFWCLIVILVHIPTAYQNRIQDMLGSFAYIGVTFFFMTSAYGLRLSVEKNRSRSIDGFWCRRLPKLLIPCLVVNMISIICGILEGAKINAWHLISINGWVQWLLVCYFIFWISYKFVGGGIKMLSFVSWLHSLVYSFISSDCREPLGVRKPLDLYGAFCYLGSKIDLPVFWKIDGL